MRITSAALCLAIAVVASSAAAAADDADRALAYSRAAVERMLRDPSSAMFAGLAIHRPRDQAGKVVDVVVCGSVNARNGFGGMTGPRPFAWSAVNRRAVLAEDDFERALVATMCDQE